MNTVESKKNINTIIETLASTNRFSHSTIFYGPNLKNTFNIMLNFSNKIHSSNLQLETITNDDIFEPEVDKIILNPTGSSIKIDMIHQLQKRIQYGSNSSKKCIVIIHQIERLTNNSANALLKTIEDPPENTIFLLSCLNKETILPTIRSRSQTFFVPDLANEQMNENKKLIEEISTELTYISPQNFLQLSEFDQCNYIQKLPKSSDQIQQLIHSWIFTLHENLMDLTIKEQKFLEKIIEIISKLNYNLNLKLQLLAITFKTEED